MEKVFLFAVYFDFEAKVLVGWKFFFCFCFNTETDRYGEIERIIWGDVLFKLGKGFTKIELENKKIGFTGK